MKKYKVLTLTQPYASLMALGAKRIETRSWSTSYRGEFLIHAGQGLGPVGGMRGLIDLLKNDLFWRALFPLRPSSFNAAGLARALPLGKIIARCELIDCRQMPEHMPDAWGYATPDAGYEWPMTPAERAFGLYEPGRWAWLTVNVQALPTPIPTRGYQRLWNWEGELGL